MTEYRADPVGMCAYRSPTEPIPRVPPVRYVTEGQSSRMSEIERLFEKGKAIHRQVALRVIQAEEQDQLWRLSVEHVIHLGAYHDIDIPISGDDRP